MMLMVHGVEGQVGAEVEIAELAGRVARLEGMMEGLLRANLAALDAGRAGAAPSTADLMPVEADGSDSYPGMGDGTGDCRQDETEQGHEGGQGIDKILAQVWHGASLPVRLKFAREMLGADNPCQAILREAQSLEELRGRGVELETWLTGYPSLFADAVERLEDRTPCGSEASESLALATLEEARQAFAAAVTALGIEWIVPQTGDRIDEEHEVVGDEEAPAPVGRVARLHRRGFRRAGHIVLPAQVTRALPQSQQAPLYNKEPENVAPIPDYLMTPEHLNTRTPEHPNTRTPSSSPAWLRTFLQQSAGCAIPAIRELAAALSDVVEAALNCAEGAMSETDLAERLEPLLPLLGAPHVPSFLGLAGEWGDLAAEARDRLVEWLKLTLDIDSIAPSVGEAYDPAVMQIVSTRRTAHAHEDGAVAKVERIGLRCGSRVLFRAHVLCYELRAGYE